MRGNATRNQHFLSRVEQKLNALNPGSSSQKFRIYSFRLINRQTYEIALENPRGHSVDTSLSMLDLFSFDVPGGSQLRVNLEGLFYKYEVDVETYTKSCERRPENVHKRRNAGRRPIFPVTPAV